MENLNQGRKQITIWLDLFSPVFPKLFCFVKKKLFCFEEAAAVGYEKSTVELQRKALRIVYNPDAHFSAGRVKKYIFLGGKKGGFLWWTSVCQSMQQAEEWTILLEAGSW